MTNLLHIISTKIMIVFTTVMVSITSILPWSGPKTIKLVDTPTAQPTEVIVEVSTPSITGTPTPTPIVKTRVETTPIPISTPLPTVAPQTTNNTLPTPNAQPQTYAIVPISVMNIGAMEPHLQIIAQRAYQEFLRTPNLSRLDESNQIEILIGIYARILREEVVVAKQNLLQLKQENISTSTPTPVPIYTNPEVETKLSELRQTLENIQNQPVAMNIIAGRTQRAYQDWITNNPTIYSVILGSRYINDLNAILRAYGL